MSQSFQWTWQRFFWSQEHICLWSRTKTDILDTCCCFYKTLGAPRLNPAALQTLGEKPCSDSIYWTLTFNTLKFVLFYKSLSSLFWLIDNLDIFSFSPRDCKHAWAQERRCKGGDNYAFHWDPSSSTSEQQRKGTVATSARDMKC